MSSDSSGVGSRKSSSDYLQMEGGIFIVSFINRLCSYCIEVDTVNSLDLLCMHC